MSAAKAQAEYESPALILASEANNRRRRDPLQVVNSAASVPGWTAALYLLWRIMEQNEEMLRLIRVLAAKSGVF